MIQEHPVSKPTLTSAVSKICFTCSMFVMFHVYFVNIPSGKASRRTNPVVELGRRFFLFPADILCWRQSKNPCGAWNTSGSGLPATTYNNIQQHT